MPNDMTMLDISTHYVAVMRGWQKLEEHVIGSGYDIVDFDLAPESEHAQIATREQVESNLIDIYKSALEVAGHNSIFAEKILGSLTFCQVLLGKDVQFDDFVYKTQGFRPRLIQANVLVSYREACKNLLEGAGLCYARECITDYNNTFSVQNAEEIVELMNQATNSWLSSAKAEIGFRGDVAYDFEFVDRDEPWNVGLFGNRHGTHVLINTNKRHVFYRGQCKYLPSHEIAGHALQFHCRRLAIDSGNMLPAYGIVSVFNPDIAISEGLAQVVPYILKDKVDLECDFLLAKTLREHRDITLHNGHIMYEHGTGMRDVVLYCLGECPFLSEEDIHKTVVERSTNPILRSYMASYAHSLLSFKVFLEKNRKEFVCKTLRKMYWRTLSARRFFSKWEPIVNACS